MPLASMHENLPVPVADVRRIEIVCNGFLLWHGAQLAVHTTCTTLNPASLFGSQHGASVAKPTPSYRVRPDATAFLRLLAQASAASARAAVRSALRSAYVSSRWSGIMPWQRRGPSPYLAHCSSSLSRQSPPPLANRRRIRSRRTN